MFAGNRIITDGAHRGTGSTGLKPALQERSEEQDVLSPQKPSEFRTEAPPQTPRAMLSTNPEELPKQTSRPTTPTKPEALQAAAPQQSPYYLHEEEPSGDAKNVSTSATLAPNGKQTPTSSDLEQEVDLEAGHRSEDFDKKESETDTVEVYSNLVDWDGPDDPKNPINWSEKLKWANIAVIASFTFLT